MTIEKKKTLCKFKKFLCNNHLLNTFVYYIEDKNNYFKYDFDFTCLKDYLEKTDKEKFVLNAFDWSHTKQGHNFWSDLDSKWKFYAWKHY